MAPAPNRSRADLRTCPSRRRDVGKPKSYRFDALAEEGIVGQSHSLATTRRPAFLVVRTRVSLPNLRTTITTEERTERRGAEAELDTTGRRRQSTMMMTHSAHCSRGVRGTRWYLQRLASRRLAARPSERESGMNMESARAALTVAASWTTGIGEGNASRGESRRACDAANS